jgi:hypothetical protein
MQWFSVKYNSPQRLSVKEFFLRVLCASVVKKYKAGFEQVWVHKVKEFSL